MGHSFQRLSEPHATLDMGRQQMKPDAERTVPRLSGRENGPLQAVALFKTVLQKVEKKPRALLSAQRQTDEKVKRVEQPGERHQANEEPQPAAPEQSVHGPSPPSPPRKSIVPANRRNRG